MKGKTLLLVDDEAIILESLSADLRSEGYHVTTAKSGDRAIAELKHGRFDLVITDLRMEGLDGIQVLKHTKEMTPHIPVIILTGHGEMTSAINALRLGADDYVLKPCDIDELLIRISYCFEKQDLMEQLKVQNQKLLDEITARKQAEEALRESERKLFTLLGNLPGMAYRCMNDRDWTMEFVSDGCVQLTGYSPADLIGNRTVAFNDLIQPADRESVWEQVQEGVEQKLPFQLIYRIRNASGEEKWVWEQGVGVFAEDGELLALEGFITDITERKQAEEVRQKAHDDLDRRIKERTAELEETTVALKVLLQKREMDKQKLEEQMMDNVIQIVEPYLEKLQKSGLTDQQKAYAETLGTNLRDLLSPMATNLSSKFFNLTPAEVQIANLIKRGKTTKEIADLLNLSPGTISVHRKSIRNKVGITNKKLNLQTLLTSYD